MGSVRSVRSVRSNRSVRSTRWVLSIAALALGIASCSAPPQDPPAEQDPPGDGGGPPPGSGSGSGDPLPGDCEPAGAARVAASAPSRPSLASAAVLATAQAVDPACPITIAPRAQLLITDLSVVNDPVRTRWTGARTNPDDGAWHLGRLLTEMAGEQDATAFVRSWMAQWENDIELNGQVVKARPAVFEFIDGWPRTPNGKLDLTRAPFRLSAIVNRFDLRGPQDAGELRLVYTAFDTTDAPIEFMVIVEYRVPAASAAEVAAWAQGWKDLGGATLGSAAYRSALAALTNRVTRRGANPGATNGSALAQVRSNEIYLGTLWQLREFHLDAAGQLRMAPLAQTPEHEDPGISLNNTPRLARFIRENAAAVMAQTHAAPERFGCGPFAAAAVTNSSDHWIAPGLTDSTLRHRFSLSTCNGCHGRETETMFVHIEPRVATEESRLSPFLLGSEVADPVTGQLRTFGELASRAQLLRAFLCAAP